MVEPCIHTTPLALAAVSTDGLLLHPWVLALHYVSSLPLKVKNLHSRNLPLFLEPRDGAWHDHSTLPSPCHFLQRCFRLPPHPPPPLFCPLPGTHSSGYPLDLGESWRIPSLASSLRKTLCQRPCHAREKDVLQHGDCLDSSCRASFPLPPESDGKPPPTGIECTLFNLGRVSP